MGICLPNSPVCGIEVKHPSSGVEGKLIQFQLFKLGPFNRKCVHVCSRQHVQPASFFISLSSCKLTLLIVVRATSCV